MSRFPARNRRGLASTKCTVPRHIKRPTRMHVQPAGHALAQVHPGRSPSIQYRPSSLSRGGDWPVLRSKMGYQGLHARCSRINSGIRCKTLVPLADLLQFPRRQGLPVYCDIHQRKFLAEDGAVTVPFRSGSQRCSPLYARL